MYPLLQFLGIIAICLVLQVAVACWEKRKVWPYAPLQPESPQMGAYTGYAERWAADAQAAGCILLGWTTLTTGEKYKVRYAVLTTPERDCLMTISTGTIFGMFIQGTVLYTLAANDREFYTTDAQAAVEFDITRSAISQLTSADTVVSLLEKHRVWVASQKVVVEPFPVGREFERYRAYREAKYRRMAEKKWVSFTDGATTWRYTLMGAVMQSFGGYFVGLLRNMTGGKFPRGA